MNIVEKVECLSAEIHKGQLRKYSKTLYIEHPRTVRFICRKLSNLIINVEAVDNHLDVENLVPIVWRAAKSSKIFANNSKQDWKTILTTILDCVSLLHDAEEDHPDKFTATNLYKILSDCEDYNNFLVSYIVEALTLLKKDNNHDYFEYLELLKKNPFATLVKLADLQHNKSDLQAGTLFDKYMLAEYFLLN